MAHVREHGWHVVGVGGGGEVPDWAFTVGLWHSYRIPEVAIFGLELHGLMHWSAMPPPGFATGHQRSPAHCSPTPSGATSSGANRWIPVGTIHCSVRPSASTDRPGLARPGTPLALRRAGHPGLPRAAQPATSCRRAPKGCLDPGSCLTAKPPAAAVVESHADGIAYWIVVSCPGRRCRNGESAVTGGQADSAA
ncbi:DUF4262 domain-containing protein [Kitasatospora sp. NPDC050543]|uniref:DUF4262 domain-containing protein n=1 Tax=Kitasatospora sp. NPDC050543 TaxID=3364054 RepID=UPI003794470D